MVIIVIGIYSLHLPDLHVVTNVGTRRERNKLLLGMKQTSPPKWFLRQRVQPKGTSFSTIPNHGTRFEFAIPTTHIVAGDLDKLHGSYKVANLVIVLPLARV